MEKTSAPSVWDLVLGRIEAKVSRHSFITWFKPTSLLEDSGEKLVVRVPNALFTTWVPRHYAVAMAEALQDVGRPDVHLVFVPEGTAADPTASVSSEGSTDTDLSESGEEAARVVSGSSAGLNPRYTFDTFIVGPSNQFAHAACRAVAEAPSVSYNPLFIYGGTGLGKTHLMHAIGDYVTQHHRSYRLTYISSERFMNEMINALRFDRILDFRERYRTVDVLLVDDIQFVAGKEGTQNEFFHTFNALHDAQKQIVISSDRPPQDIPQLEERLRSRFGWGLTADIQPPDIETRIAILKKRAESEGVPLPDGVALFMASRVKSNIRELEGSLIRLLAYASMQGRSLSLELAQEVLRGSSEHDGRAITIDQIQRFVADYYQMKLADLKSRNNSKSIAGPRQVAMFLCKSLTQASLPEIGRSFGGKHHSTVIHSVNKVEEKRRADPVFNSLLTGMLESLK